MDWKEYPKETPDGCGKYFITCKVDGGVFIGEAYFESNRAQYGSDGFKFYGPLWVNEDGTSYCDVGQEVIAFMEYPEPIRPKPYKPQ